MKKLRTLILAALFLASCTGDTSPAESPEQNPAHDSAVLSDEQEPEESEGFAGTLPVSLPYLASFDGFDVEGKINSGTYTAYPLMYTDGGNLYLCLGGNQIVTYTDPTSTSVSSVTLEGIGAGITALAFAVHEDEILFVTNCMENNAAYRFDRNGKLLESAPFPVHTWFCDFMPAFVGDDLYYLDQEGVDENTHTYSNSDPARRILYRTNPWSGEKSTIGENVRAFCVSGGNVYFVESRMNDQFETEYILCRFHPEDSTITEESALNLHLSHTDALSSVIGYDIANRILYYQFSGAVFAHPLGTEENLLISRCAHNFRTDGGIFAMDTRQGTLELYRTVAELVDFSDLMPTLRIASLAAEGVFNPLAYADPLAVLEEWDQYLAAEGAYTCAFTDTDEYAYTMAKKLMAGDDDFDIFMVTTEMSSLLQERYYENLAGYEVLSDYYNEMIPGLTRICTVDSTLALIPSKLSYDMMLADDSLTESPASLPDTLEDFPGFLAKTAPELKDGAYFMIPPNSFIFYVPWFRQLASYYIIENPDESAVRQDLTDLYRLITEINAHPSVDPSVRNTGKPYLQLNISVMKRSKKVPRGSRITPVPPIKEGYSQTVSGTFWAVNPASPNKEAAAQFLAALMETEKNSFDTLFFDVYPDETTDALFGVMKDITKDALRAWDIPDLVPRLAEQFAKIESGSLTPEDAAEEMWRYLRMLKNE